MPTIPSIPDKYKSGFKKLSLIEDEVFALIEKGLSYSSLVSSLRILTTKIVEMQTLNLEDIRDIFISVGSLISLLENESISQEIADDIISLSIKDNLIEEQDAEKFRYRLLFLLNNKQIYYAAKAQRLFTENGNIYIGSRIITDLRPIFDLSLNIAPKAGVIIHHLHIHYRADEESDHKDIYVSLDSSDIKSLKKALERAESKEISMQTIFENSGMANLNE